jgi:hypothetical protein
MKTLDHRPYTGKYFDSEDFDRGIITRLGGKIATNFTQMLFVNQSHRGDWYFFMLFVEWMTKTRLPSRRPSHCAISFCYRTPLVIRYLFNRFPGLCTNEIRVNFCFVIPAMAGMTIILLQRLSCNNI